MIHTITAKNAYSEILNGDALLIDVREPDEFKAKHIAYAVNIPLSCLTSTLEKTTLPSNKKIIFHCQKGKRGEQACQSVTALAKTTDSLYNIEGGIEAWENQNLPIIGLSTSRIPLVRQTQIAIGLILIALSLTTLFTSVKFIYMILFIGAALTFAGLTGWCGLQMLLSLMPWNNKKPK